MAAIARIIEEEGYPTFITLQVCTRPFRGPCCFADAQQTDGELPARVFWSMRSLGVCPYSNTLE